MKEDIEIEQGPTSFKTIEDAISYYRPLYQVIIPLEKSTDIIEDIVSGKIRRGFIKISNK